MAVQLAQMLGQWLISAGLVFALVGGWWWLTRGHMPVEGDSTGEPDESTASGCTACEFTSGCTMAPERYAPKAGAPQQPVGSSHDGNRITEVRI